VGADDRVEIGAAVLLLAVEDHAHRPLRAAAPGGVEGAQHVGEMLALVVGAAARDHGDGVERAVVEPARVDDAVSLEVRRLEGLAGHAVPAPALDVAGRLHVVVAVEQQRRRALRSRDLAPQRRRAPLGRGERLEGEADLAPQRADIVDHRRRHLAADGGEAKIPVEQGETGVAFRHRGSSVGPR